MNESNANPIKKSFAINWLSREGLIVTLESMGIETERAENIVLDISDKQMELYAFDIGDFLVDKKLERYEQLMWQLLIKLVNDDE